MNDNHISVASLRCKGLDNYRAQARNRHEQAHKGRADSRLLCEPRLPICVFCARVIFRYPNAVLVPVLEIFFFDLFILFSRLFHFFSSACLVGTPYSFPCIHDAR